MEVHRVLGPGLLESAYEVCLEFELKQKGLTVARQVPLPVVYKGIPLEAGYRIDLIVNECLLVEVKAVEVILPVHEAQLMTYLRLSGIRTGLLLNFNATTLKESNRRRIL